MGEDCSVFPSVGEIVNKLRKGESRCVILNEITARCSFDTRLSEYLRYQDNTVSNAYLI